MYTVIISPSFITKTKILTTAAHFEISEPL